jgi:hypothetical protein
VVQLEEFSQVHMVGRIRGPALDLDSDFEIGSAVRVVWADHATVSLPCFEPIGR